MRKARIDENVLREVLAAQQNEITEHQVYLKLAGLMSGKNRSVLRRIAADELRHYHFWKEMTGREIGPERWKVAWYVFLAKLLGVNFSLKLMEKGEDLAAVKYAGLSGNVREAERIMKDEQKHEKALLDMLEEERLEYASSIVLGLNDALVELTGALAGLTLALQNSTLVALSGFITGFAASLSMAASEYLSSKEEKGKNPLKSAAYTGIAYIFTVLLLISPYFFMPNIYASLLLMLVLGIGVVFAYTYYVSTAKNQKFWPRFLEMAVISLSVAALSFGVGWLVRVFLGVEV